MRRIVNSNGDPFVSLSEPCVVRELIREDVQNAEFLPQHVLPPPLIAAIDIAARPAIYYRQKTRLPSSKKNQTNKLSQGTRPGETRRSYVYKS
jgi:hypothetical protein